MSEEILLSNKESQFSATTERVRLTGKNDISSIKSDKITSIQVEYSHEPVLIALSLISLAVFFGLFINYGNLNLFIFGLVISVCFAAFYFFSKKRTLIICSASLSISIGIKSFSQEESLELVNQIESLIPVQEPTNYGGYQ